MGRNGKTRLQEVLYVSVWGGTFRVAERQGRVVLDTSREMKGADRGEGARRMRAPAPLRGDAEINEGTCVSNGCEKGSCNSTIKIRDSLWSKWLPGQDSFDKVPQQPRNKLKAGSGQVGHYGRNILFLPA